MATSTTFSMLFFAAPNHEYRLLLLKKYKYTNDLIILHFHKKMQISFWFEWSSLLNITFGAKAEGAGSVGVGGGVRPVHCHK